MLFRYDQGREKVVAKVFLPLGEKFEKVTSELRDCKISGFEYFGGEKKVWIEAPGEQL